MATSLNSESQYHSGYNNSNTATMEAGLLKDEIGFDNRSIRAGFIRKVFSIVAMQLLLVTGMCAFAIFHEGTNKFVRANEGLYWAGYGVFIVVYFALICCESVRRNFPSNLIATAILTLSMGYMVMMITAWYKVESVLLALAITAACSFSIALFACQTKHDLTSMIGFMFIAGMVLFFFGIVAVLSLSIWHIKFLYVIYAALGALFFMVYLAIDIQMIMGGKKYEISAEDYIFAAIQVFLDIINIFLLILSLIGGNRN